MDTESYTMTEENLVEEYDETDMGSEDFNQQELDTDVSTEVLGARAGTAFEELPDKQSSRQSSEVVVLNNRNNRSLKHAYERLDGLIHLNKLAE